MDSLVYDFRPCVDFPQGIDVGEVITNICQGAVLNELNKNSL